MLTIRIATIALMSLLLIGCKATTPTSHQLEVADYGNKPSLPIAKQQAEVLIKSMLKDPMSAQFTWGQLDKGWFKSRGKPIRYAWRLNVGVNAKNSFGGYTGSKLYVAYYRDNELVGMVTPHTLYGGGRPMDVTVTTEFGSNVDWGDNEDLPKEPTVTK